MFAQMYEGGGLQKPLLDPVDLFAGLGAGALRGMFSKGGEAVTADMVGKKLGNVGAYSLGPPQALRSGNGAVHSILDAAGDEVGVVKVVPSGSALRIETVQGLGGKLEPNALGVGQMKGLVRQLKNFYPEAERISGLRTTGARVGTDAFGRPSSVGLR